MNFDPHSVAAEDEFTFEAHSSINECLEEHMRHTLDKNTRRSMHRDHPIPNTPAMKPPQVDKFIRDHLASRFPAWGRWGVIESTVGVTQSMQTHHVHVV